MTFLQKSPFIGPAKSGTITVDFGSAPGQYLIETVVSGQAGIVQTSTINVKFTNTATVSNTIGNHLVASMFTVIVVKEIVDNTSFTIAIKSEVKLRGEFNLFWEWQ